MTLSVREMESILDSVQYREGWELEVYATEFQGDWLAVKAVVDDTYHPGQQIELRIKSPLPPMSSEGAFLTWLRWRLEVIEVHECHENLRWKSSGKPIYDPHGDGADEPTLAATYKLNYPLTTMTI